MGGDLVGLVALGRLRFAAGAAGRGDLHGRRGRSAAARAETTREQILQLDEPAGPLTPWRAGFAGFRGVLRQYQMENVASALPTALEIGSMRST
jgi:hypothetical protein